MNPGRTFDSLKREALQQSAIARNTLQGRSAATAVGQEAGRGSYCRRAPGLAGKSEPDGRRKAIPNLC